MSHSSASHGAVNYGDILAKVQVKPTQHMFELAAQANVPGGNGYAATDPYDPIAIALYWAELGYKVMPLKSLNEIRRGGYDEDQGGKIPALKGPQSEQGTRDSELIRQWWTDDPFRGVGIPTQAN